MPFSDASWDQITNLVKLSNISYPTTTQNKNRQMLAQHWFECIKSFNGACDQLCVFISYVSGQQAHCEQCKGGPACQNRDNKNPWKKLKNLAWGNFMQSSKKQVWALELLPVWDPQDAIRDEAACNNVWAQPSKMCKIVWLFIALRKKLAVMPVNTFTFASRLLEPRSKRKT